MIKLESNQRPNKDQNDQRHWVIVIYIFSQFSYTETM